MERFSGPTEISLCLNGEERKVIVRPAQTLLRVLRETVGLTGAKAGCENGDCGACTVLLDGRPVKSCLVLALETKGREVTTIEGLKDTPIQKAFEAEFAFQCGFCTPGMILKAQALLQAHPRPDPETIKTWLESNLCRCTGYQAVARAVQRAAGQRE